MYGYTSIDSSCCWASFSASGKVCSVRPQLAEPAHLWCDSTSGNPDCCAVPAASSMASRMPSNSSRMCVAYTPPWRAASVATATSSCISAA
ncbi:hypothetical protein D3C72_1592890 [compost metagenome]